MFSSIKKTLTRLTDHLIESPCIAVCIMHSETGLCKGCYRTLAEIEGWPTFTGDEKRKVIHDSAARKTATSLRP